MNLLTWDRAAAVEYDNWEAVGNPGWNWKTMSAAMEKAETYVGGPRGSGMSGPIHAVISRMLPPHAESFIPTVANNFPIPFNPDSLQGNSVGVMFQPSNIDPASYNRSYSANAYLPLAGPNLAILTNTEVVKVNFKKQARTLRATGVTLTDGSTLTARREVILSAGTIGTPGLLERSGIGQAAVLRAAGLGAPLVELRGVGENYQDHLRVQVSYQLREGFVAGDELNTNATFAAEEWAKRLRGEPGFYDDPGSGYIFADWKRVVEGGR